MGSDADNAALLALAERCEAATGADRELDCAIMDALSLWPEGWTRYEGREPMGSGSVYYLHPSGRPEWHVAFSYTASLDAAMTLIGSDVFWHLGNDGEGPDPSLFKARLLWFTSDHPHSLRQRRALATAATPALALVAAALSALAASNPHKEPA